MKTKFKLKSTGGVPIGKYPPEQHIGEVVGIQILKEDNLFRDRREFHNERVISVMVEWDGDRRSEVFFKIGDVTPTKMGDKVYGTAVTNQWGSTSFIITHLLAD